MFYRRWYLLFATIILAGTGVISWLVGSAAQASSTVRGVVLDPDGPVAGARVRVRATENLTFTLADGSFILKELEEGERIEVAAWADSYYIASKYVTPTITGVTLTLRPYHTTDHPDYEWVSPISGTSEVACGNCHPMILPQWSNNAHGGAIDNNRFFSLYSGTDISGTVSIGPGYLNDFPGTAGVCANCHAPGAGVDGYLTTNMNNIRGDLTSGIHCDFCHKVGGAYLNPATGTVYPNAPGVTSLKVLRPPAGDQIFFGPYDDIHDPDTYLPLISESQFCATCHQFSFWGTPIYESYEEWLASEYAVDGVTCQNCHMLPNGDAYFALPEVGGLEHPPEKIPSHLQIGATDVNLLQNTIRMDVSAQQILDQLKVTVVIKNTGAGHHVPTDFPGRQMILILTANDEEENQLILYDGATIPTWGGEYAGFPGVVYAKVLKDVETGESPVVSYWKQTLIVSDNRIPALEADTSHYTFDIPEEVGEITISAKMVFRRIFQSISDQKGWDIPDILMEEITFTLSPTLNSNIYIPHVLIRTVE